MPVYSASGYENLRWNSSSSVVKKAFPHVKKMTPCYFEGVNIFGPDTLKFAVEKITSENIEKKIYSFFKNGLVAVELDYRTFETGEKGFKKNVIAKLVKTYGKANMSYWKYQDKTKEGHCFIWCTKEDVVLAVYGHFKAVSPNNLDWVKVTHYKRKFFDYKNQRCFCKSFTGVSKLFFR